MKRIIFLSLICLLAVFTLVNKGQSQIKSYYSGDAVNFNSQLYVGSTNTDSLEVFKLENSNLKQLVKIRPFDTRFSRYGSFYDLKFSVENGNLYVYAVDGFTLYKYELVNDNRLDLVFSQKNTYWEWYNRVDKFGDNIVTISDKGVKIWNKDLQVIDSYSLSDVVTPYNLRANNNNFIIDVQDNHLVVFNRENRSILASIPVNYKDNPGNRQVYQDQNNNLFIVDDYYAKKFNLSGQLLGSFKHLDYAGFDVAVSGSSNYLYFSNGIGVVKLKQDDMKLVSSRWTTNLGGARGWAMGLKAVYAGGEKIVVFNNSNILVLDENLKKLASFQAAEEADSTSLENLYLNLDHNFGASSATINLNGGGYLPNENLTINFGGSISSVIADSRGRFTQKLTVPTLTNPRAVDIKVDGQNSQSSYSISFNIK